MYLPDYAELHCLSNFSFLRGASHPEELVKRAVELGYTALAITDECSLAGAARAHIASRGAPLKLIIGSEFVLSDGFRLVLLEQRERFRFVEQRKEPRRRNHGSRLRYIGECAIFEIQGQHRRIALHQLEDVGFLVPTDIQIRRGLSRRRAHGQE